MLCVMFLSGLPQLHYVTLWISWSVSLKVNLPWESYSNPTWRLPLCGLQWQGWDAKGKGLIASPGTDKRMPAWQYWWLGPPFSERHPEWHSDSWLITLVLVAPQQELEVYDPILRLPTVTEPPCLLVSTTACFLQPPHHSSNSTAKFAGAVSGQLSASCHQHIEGTPTWNCIAADQGGAYQGEDCPLKNTAYSGCLLELSSSSTT